MTYYFLFDRTHPLAKHSELLTCIETRVSYLSMSYSKYIEANLCCIIPRKVPYIWSHITERFTPFQTSILLSKVIDEVIKVLKSIIHTKPTEKTGIPLRIPEVLQELHDISSMAIKHFEEHIV